MPRSRRWQSVSCQAVRFFVAMIAAGVGRVVDFPPIAVSLRREILRFYYDDGKRLLDDAGLNTLATNSGLAESRAAILEHAFEVADIDSLDGLKLLDIGCGFGALALLFAARGAEVVAVDPNMRRFAVGQRVAEEHNLPVRWMRASMEGLDVGESDFDIAVMNNSLCYVVPRAARRAALEGTWAALRPGGVLVLRNPNRVHPVDQFCGVPLLGLLPPTGAKLAARVLRRHRSEVRLLTRRAARRELIRSGFEGVEIVRRPSASRWREAVAGYQHLIGRRP